MSAITTFSPKIIHVLCQELQHLLQKLNAKNWNLQNTCCKMYYYICLYLIKFLYVI